MYYRWSNWDSRIMLTLLHSGVSIPPFSKVLSGSCMDVCMLHVPKMVGFVEVQGLTKYKSPLTLCWFIEVDFVSMKRGWGESFCRAFACDCIRYAYGNNPTENSGKVSQCIDVRRLQSGGALLFYVPRVYAHSKYTRPHVWLSEYRFSSIPKNKKENLFFCKSQLPRRFRFL